MPDQAAAIGAFALGLMGVLAGLAYWSGSAKAAVDLVRDAVRDPSVPAAVAHAPAMLVAVGGTFLAVGATLAGFLPTQLPVALLSGSMLAIGLAVGLGWRTLLPGWAMDMATRLPAARRIDVVLGITAAVAGLALLGLALSQASMPA